MARSETFQMSIDWLPERRLLSEAARDCADRASSVAKEKYGSRISLGNRPRAAVAGSRPLLGQPRRIQVCSCSRFTGLLPV